MLLYEPTLCSLNTKELCISAAVGATFMSVGAAVGATFMSVGAAVGADFMSVRSPVRANVATAQTCKKSCAIQFKYLFFLIANLKWERLIILSISLKN